MGVEVLEEWRISGDVGLELFEARALATFVEDEVFEFEGEGC